MTTLTAGSTATFSLSNRQVLTLTAESNTTGTLKRTQYIDGQSSKTDVLGPPATNRTYGPYGHETDIEITCTYGSFEYDVTGTSLVTAETDPVTGGIKKATSGNKDLFLSIGAQVKRQFKGAAKWFGSAQSGATYNIAGTASDVGFRIKMDAEADFDAVQLVWVNRASTALTNCRALVAVTETAAVNTAANVSKPVINGTAYDVVASAGSVLGHRAVTWSGAATASPGAATTAAQVVVSDKIPLSSIPRADGGSRPLLLISQEHAGTTDGAHAFLSTPQCAANRSGSTENRGRFVQTINVTNAVTVPANSASVMGVNALEVFPIFSYRNPSITVMVAGDSTSQNDAILYDGLSSWGWRGCMDASTPGRPVNFINAGCSSKGSAEYWLRAKEIIAAGVPVDVLVVGPASVNDTYSTNSDSYFESARSRTVDMIEYAQTNGVRAVVLIPLLPYNTNSAGTDAYRVAFNAFLKERASLIPGVYYLDFSALGDGAAPERWIPSYNAKKAWQWILLTLPKSNADATGYVGGTTYTATVTISGTACAISFLGSQAATFGDLCSVLNTQINAGMGTSGQTYAVMKGGNLLITSVTAGAGVAVAVTAGTVFASPLANFSAVPGSMAASGSADGLHENETAIESVLAPALAEILSEI